MARGNKLRIAVIGCGTAGSAAALFLARAGHEVTVFERVAEPKPVGAGIIVQPTGQAVLSQLGLLGHVANRAAKLDRLWLRAPSGRTLVDLHYARIDPSMHGLGTHRGVLFDALFQAVKREVLLRVGSEIIEIRGNQIVDHGMRLHGPFDRILVSDGSLSRLRADHVARDSTYPWGALWFVAPDREHVFTRELYQVASHARQLYGVLPTGQGPDGVPCASLFWSIAAADLPAWRARGLDAWKADVRALDPRIDLVLDQIHSLDQLTFARYRDVTMPRWDVGHVAFIGDAAHAASPQLGQGANLALVDALVAAEEIHDLSRYTRRRRRHLAYYQFMTRALTPFFQSHSRVLATLRDLTFPIANRIAPFRSLMIRTMAGLVCLPSATANPVPTNPLAGYQ
ncbi:MAG TPA: NAD(P)/FAD-dependent oxidoreductase [Kofleriaceae bacterium]